MTRARSQAEVVVEFFSEAPMESVETVLGIVRGVVERRRSKRPAAQAKGPAPDKPTVKPPVPQAKAKAKPAAKAKGNGAETPTPAA